MNQRAQSFVLYLLRGYKWALSPLMGPACRYVPSCSDYAMEAVDRYGVFRGGLMAMWRVLRCHPFVQGGYDPVVKVPVVRSQVAESQIVKSQVVKSEAVKSERYGVTLSSAPPASCAVTE